MEEQKTESNLFQTLWPGMIQHTRLLIVDLDVCRYHTFDLMRWQLAIDSRTHDMDHFMSLRSDLEPLLHGKTDWADQVNFMRSHVNQVNIYDCFGVDPRGVRARGDYTAFERRMWDMLKDPKAKITETDIGARFSIVFDRDDIHGFLVQYEDDPYKPTFSSQVKVIKGDYLLDNQGIARFIMENRINALMIGSMEAALSIALQLLKNDYKKPLTIIAGRYAYNYEYNRFRGKLLPKFGSLCQHLEVKYKYEFGYFDSFTGLTYRDRVLSELNKEEETPNASE